MMAGVCLSVCPVPDPKSRTEGHGKLKIGRRKACDPRLEVKGQGHQAVIENQPYLRNRNAY